MIDLRSDTVTRPTERMRAAMAAAEVGDDVFGEDPTVNRLQDRAAEIFEKDAALWVPTGSMANEIAVRVHTRPGTDIVAEERGHILNYELGAAAVISGVTIRPVRSMDGSGHLNWGEIEPAIHVDQPYWVAPTTLICLENTHNFAGGSVMTAEHCADICARAHLVGLPVHLDGSRIFNAAAALGEPVSDLARDCDSVMFTLSKGLGAPAGSILLGSREFIAESRVWRKRLGGGMRQVGVLAAAGLIAIEEGPARLYADHENARALALGLAEIDGVDIDLDRVVTNIVIFGVSGSGRTAANICLEMKELGMLAIAISPTRIRMVTHCDVTAADIAAAIGIARRVLTRRPAEPIDSNSDRDEY